MDTPEARIAAAADRVMRAIQNRYPPRDTLQGLYHVSRSDFEEGLRGIVRYELDLARQEALTIPFRDQEAKRREIAARLAKPYD